MIALNRRTILLSPFSGRPALLSGGITWGSSPSTLRCAHSTTSLASLFPRFIKCVGLVGIGDRPTPPPPLRTAPLLDPYAYANPNPSLLPDRPAPPMPINFANVLGYTVNGDALGPADCKGAWERVEKTWGGTATCRLLWLFPHNTT